MNSQKKLSGTAIGFLFFVAILADASKFALDLLFGVGFILDPFLITPLTTGVFWITLSHNGVSMFSGKNWVAAWTNEIISLTPGVDALPDWTVYTSYLVMNNRIADLTQGIIS